MYGALFSLRVELSPRLALRELATGQTTELSVISCHLDRVTVRGNRHPSNLRHRDNLLDVVLRGPASDENHAGLLPTPLEAHYLKIIQHRIIDHRRPSLVELVIPVHCQCHPDGAVGECWTEDGKVFPRGGGENAVLVVDSLTHELEKFPTGVAPGLKTFRELLNKLVSLREHYIIRVSIIDSVYSHRPQGRVINVMVGHVMSAPKRLVKVVTEVCTCGYENIDCMEGDEVAKESPHSPSNHRARQTEEDYRTIGIVQHVKPDLVTPAKHSTLERCRVKGFQSFTYSVNLRYVKMLHWMFERIAPWRELNTR